MMRHVKPPIPMLVGVMAIALLLGACGQQSSSQPQRSTQQVTTTAPENLDWVRLSMAPTVQVSLTSEEIISGTLDNLDATKLMLRIAGESQAIALNDVTQIESTGEIWREVNGTRSRIRGEANANGEPWPVPLEQFRFIPADATTPDAVEINLDSVSFEYPDEQRAAIDKNYPDPGYIVESLRPRPDGYIEVVVKVAEPIAE